MPVVNCDNAVEAKTWILNFDLRGFSEMVLLETSMVLITKILHLMLKKLMTRLHCLRLLYN